MCHKQCKFFARCQHTGLNALLFPCHFILHHKNASLGNGKWIERREIERERKKKVIRVFEWWMQHYYYPPLGWRYFLGKRVKPQLVQNNFLLTEISRCWRGILPFDLVLSLEMFGIFKNKSFCLEISHFSLRSSLRNSSKP